MSSWIFKCQHDSFHFFYFRNTSKYRDIALSPSHLAIIFPQKNLILRQSQKHLILNQSPKCLCVYSYNLSSRQRICFVSFFKLLYHIIYTTRRLFTKASSVFLISISFVKNSVLHTSISFAKRLDWTADDSSKGSSQVWSEKPHKVHWQQILAAAADIDQFCPFFLGFP